jgi:putative RNA 2'-phosphotransferase
MNDKELTKASKFLSLVLRHQPEVAGVELDDAGWVEIDSLLKGCELAGHALSPVQLEEVVATNAKKRFEISSDLKKIRASQGHSVKVQFEYEAKIPPDVLYHGTATRFIDQIKKEGLKKMQRHHVHLSQETRVTIEVGARHGKPVLLTIDAKALSDQGFLFYQSTNGVWLVDQVPTEFIFFPE